nr:immunoglobulin heavy chain junction region [Macaca mulatta]
CARVPGRYSAYSSLDYW